jgi:hypothetical protein
MKKILVFAFAICLFTNSNIFAKTYKTSIQSTGVDDATLDIYLGKYKFKPNDIVETVEILKADNGLKANTPDGQTYMLVAMADKKGTFKIEALGATIIFVENENKKVIGLKVEMQDGTLEASKEN